jgi:hypothetical protein
MDRRINDTEDPLDRGIDGGHSRASPQPFDLDEEERSDDGDMEDREVS